MGSLGKNYTEMEGAALPSNNTSANSSPYSQGTLERQGLLQGKLRGSDARRQLDQESLLHKQGDARSKGRSDDHEYSAPAFPLKGTRTCAGAGKGVGWGSGSNEPLKAIPGTRVTAKAIVGVLAACCLVGLLVAGSLTNRQRNIKRQRHDHMVRDVADTVPRGTVITLPPTNMAPLKKAPKPSEDAAGSVLPQVDPRVNYSALLRPAYHLAASHGTWVNDPNGQMQVPSTGLSHVFYQLNPEGPVWGSPWWGHVVSRDLAHWQLLPHAFKPDMWYDRDGVFSGSAVLLSDGSPLLMYTGVMNFSQYGFYYQMQASAVPADLSDPFLVDWVKGEEPLSIEIPPGGTHAQFRDPVTPWRVAYTEVSALLAGLQEATKVVKVELPGGRGNASTAIPTRVANATGTGDAARASKGANITQAAAVGPPGVAVKATYASGRESTIVVGTGKAVPGGSGGGGGGSGEAPAPSTQLPTGAALGRLLRGLGSLPGLNGVRAEQLHLALAPPASVAMGRAREGVGNATGGGEGNETAEASGDVWMTAVGALDDCLGAAALYLSTDDLQTWQYAGTLFSQLAMNTTQYAQCLPPPQARDLPPPYLRDDEEVEGQPPGAMSYGGHCDQFGTECRMWECPDFFHIADGVTVFKFSDQERGRRPFSADFYVLGDTHLTNYTAALVQDGRDAYSAILGGTPYPARLLDWGAMYASKTWEDSDGRRLLMGWAYEESKGCTEVCADGTPFIKNIQRWQGSQTLIRVVGYDPEAEALLFTPVPETDLLRAPTPLLNTSLTLPAATPPVNMTASQPAHTDAVVSGTVSASARRNGTSNLSQPSVSVLLPEVPPMWPPPAPTSTNSSASGAQLPDSPSGRRQVEASLKFTLRLPGNATNATMATGSGRGDEGQNVGGGAFRQPFDVGVRLLTGNNTFVRIFINGTARLSTAKPNRGGGSSSADSNATATASLGKKQGSQVLMAQQVGVYVDKSRAGGMTQTTMQGGIVPLPPRGVAADDLHLHIYVDRSILEVYALGGRGVVTSRIYEVPLAHPDAAAADAAALGQWGMEAFSTWSAGPTQVQAVVYEMGSCWVESVQ